MKAQIELFSGPQLRDIGIQRAIDHANTITVDWSDHAYRFLCRYILSHTEFMAEDVRVASSGIVPEPPSKRAWGGVLVRAVKNGLIKRKGFRNVSNAKAHSTPATLWEKT